jgi:hypothetical protein
MFRKFASTFLSLVIGLSPMSASAEGFVFRYKMPMSEKADPVDPEDPDFGIGNDIQAWFVAPVGYPFRKDIPVATDEVAKWAKSSGSIPSGITLDTATGVLSGSAEHEQKTETTWYGSDAGGKRIARAEMHFSAFQPVGQVTEVNWYTHTGEYFYRQVPAPSGIDVVRWDSIVDLPKGLAMRNGALDGRPEKAGTYGLAWRGYDYLDREVAFTYGEFLVEDEPKVEKIADEVVDKMRYEKFTVSPVVKHSIGTLTYALKPVDIRPAGISFSSSDGAIRGVFDDFNTTAKFVIEARDSGSGRVGRSNEFSLTTLPEPLDLSAIPDLHGAVGSSYFARVATSYSNAFYDVVEGKLPDGLTLQRETGIIYGVPEQTETQEGIRIAVSGNGVIPTTSNPFTFRIHSTDLKVALDPVHVRIGDGFTSSTPSIVNGAEAPYRYHANASTLPQGISFDNALGQFHSDGMATAGSYDQRMSVLNASNLSVDATQIIRVYEYPTLAYNAQEVGSRFTPVSIKPQLKADSVREPAIYTLLQGTLPSFLKLDPATGVISGTTRDAADIGDYGPFVVSLVDAFDEPPVLSNAFDIRIEERKPLLITQTLDKAQRWVVNQRQAFDASNVLEGVTFTLKNRSSMPSTLGISGNGFLVGTTTDPVGTVYSGVVVEAEDGTGFKDDITANITVVQPDDISSLDGNINRTFTWTVGRDFVGFTLPRVANTYGTVDYEVGANSLGLQVNQTTLALSGNAPTTGTFTVPYTIEDETGRAPVSGILTFVIQPDMTVAQSDVDAHRGTQVSIDPVRTNGVGPFDWKIVSGRLPGTGLYPAMTFDTKTGSISGKPREEGEFPLTLEVVDRTLQTKRVSFTLKVLPPAPFSFNFGDGMMVLGTTQAIEPTFVNRSENVTWTFVSGTLPAGVQFYTTGSWTGMFFGRPSEDGLFENIVIKGVDNGTGEEWTETTALRVTRTGFVSLPSATLKHRAGTHSGSFAFSATNITEPAVYELSGNPYPSNVSIDAATGELTATFPLPGKYTVSVKVTDLFGRVGTAQATFDVVGDLSVTAPNPAQFKRFKNGSVPLTVKNLIGAGSYVASGLPSTLSVSNGTISGTPDVVETISGATVTVTDSYDGAAVTSNPFTVAVAERDPLAITAPDYQTNQYKAVDYKPSIANAVGGVAWTISPALPTDLSFDASSGRITGSMDQTFEQAYTLTATDSKGAPLGADSKTFTLKIVEREKPTLTNPSTLVAILDKPYVITLAAKNILGTAVWEHVSGALPAGLSFDPLTHEIRGTPTQFGAVSNILIRVTDTYKGIATVGNNLVTIDVRQDGTAITLQVAGLIPFRLGEVNQSATPVAENTVGNVTWGAVGLAGSGLAIDPATGVISGTPTTEGDLSIIVGVSDVTGRSQSQQVTVRVIPPIEISFPSQNALLYNYTFEKLSQQGSASRSGSPAKGVQPQGSNIYGVPTWSISPASGLPAGLTFDTATGKFLGKPLQLGEFGPFTLSLSDVLPGQAVTTGVTLVVTMNDDPIDLSLQDYVTKIGYPIITAAPVFDNALGDVRFFPENNDLGGTNLVVDTNTGVLSGSFTTAQDRNINVAIADQYTSRVTSRPLNLKVLPKLVLTGPALASLEAQAPIKPVAVTPANVAGTLVWKDLDAAQKALLPVGITFDASSGTFVGQSDTLGTYGPFRITAEDHFHGYTDTATSNDILLEVKPGSVYLKLSAGALAAGQKLKAYDVDVRPKLTMVGIDISEVSWTWDASKAGQVTPPGLNINGTTGHIYGTPGLAGDFTFEVIASGKGRTSRAVMTLHVEPPLFDLELKDPGNFNAVSWTAKTFDLRSLVSYKTANINLNAITFTATLNPVPTRISVGAQSMSGSYTHAGEYLFTIKGTFTSGSDVVIASTNVTVHVADPAEQAWRYWTIRFTGNVAGAFEFTGSATDAKVAEIQLLDGAGNVVAPVDGSTYYHHKAVQKTIDGKLVSTWSGDAEAKKAWDGNASTLLTDGLGSGIIFELASPGIVRKVRMTMTGTPQDVTSIQSLRSNDVGWCGGCGWLQHTSDYQYLPKPASGGTSYAAGEVIEFNLYPGQP